MKILKNNDRTIHIDFMRYELVQKLKRNLKEFPLSNISNKEATDGFLCVFTYGNSIFRITYGLNEDRLYVTETKLRSIPENHLEKVQSVFEDKFGVPTIKYDLETQSTGYMVSNMTLEWAEKGKEQELIDEVQSGFGFMPGTRATNIEVINTGSEKV